MFTHEIVKLIHWYYWTPTSIKPSTKSCGMV